MSDHIAIDDAVRENLLKAIFAQYERLSGEFGIELPKFGNPGLAGREWLIAYQQYLKDLSWFIRNKIACKPSCGDGTCPPCFGWNSSDYQDYLDDLGEKSASPSRSS